MKALQSFLVLLTILSLSSTLTATPAADESYFEDDEPEKSPQCAGKKKGDASAAVEEKQIASVGSEEMRINLAKKINSPEEIDPTESSDTFPQHNPSDLTDDQMRAMLAKDGKSPEEIENIMLHGTVDSEYQEVGSDVGSEGDVTDEQMREELRKEGRSEEEINRIMDSGHYDDEPDASRDKTAQSQGVKEAGEHQKIGVGAESEGDVTDEQMREELRKEGRSEEEINRIMDSGKYDDQLSGVSQDKTAQTGVLKEAGEPDNATPGDIADTDNAEDKEEKEFVALLRKHGKSESQIKDILDGKADFEEFEDDNGGTGGDGDYVDETDISDEEYSQQLRLEGKSEAEIKKLLTNPETTVFGYSDDADKSYEFDLKHVYKLSAEDVAKFSAARLRDPQKLANPQRPAVITAANDAPRVEQLRDSPRAWVVHDFLSAAECDFITNASIPYLIPCSGRTCEEIPSHADVHGNFVLEAVEKRIFDATFEGTDEGSGFQIVRYRPNHGFPGHNDRSGKMERNIVATAMVYLNDNSEENTGETVFPGALPEALSVTPKKGMLVVWFSCFPDGKTDRSAVHYGTKLTKGEKWILNKFLYQTEESCAKSLKPPKRIQYVL